MRTIDLEKIEKLFSNLLTQAANSSILKFENKQLKSYPSHIIKIIKQRKEARKSRKRADGSDIRAILSTEYNRLTTLLKKSIKSYTEKKWEIFIDKLGPFPASSGLFWDIINRARNPKKTSNIPTLLENNFSYKTDKEKTDLFASLLSVTYTEAGVESEFDNKFYTEVEKLVLETDYQDNNYPRVTQFELDRVIKSLKTDSSPGEDGIHYCFLKNLSSKGKDLLLKLANLSLAEGMPKSWKSAIITMIPKKGKSRNPSSTDR